METTKLTIEEVEQLQAVQQKYNAVINELGNIELTKINLESRKEEVLTFLSELKTEEQTIGKELNEKYGVGTINLEKGEFTASPNVAE
jgi:hypothetical protein